jgi:17beta-estradiol 17-dehydrogenase / very-long-chain 3-oxoacyl-CoA reductase
MEVINKNRIYDAIVNGTSPWWFKVFAGLGALVTIRNILRIFKWIWVYYLRPASSFAKHRGKWAVVTGASWGIGNAFAQELAKRGMNVVLIARSTERLMEVKQELESKYKVQTKVITADFNSRDFGIYNEIEKELRGLEITMLVNNVGISTKIPQFFMETPIQESDDIVHVNVNAQNHMTKIVLPQMKERKFGTILMISSASGFPGVPSPLLSVYAGTKAYNLKSACSLHDELKRDGIEVSAVCPFFVTSKMSRTRRQTLLICQEETVARETLNKIGYGMKIIIPWVNHFMQYSITTNIPLVYNLSVKGLFGIRVRGIKRLAELEKETKKE